MIFSSSWSPRRRPRRSSCTRATLVTTGVWYHVAGVRGSNFAQIYVNGNWRARPTLTFLRITGTLPLYFGTSGEAYWDHKLNGTLDEVSLYNRALSADEIAAIYAAGARGSAKSPAFSPNRRANSAIGVAALLSPPWRRGPTAELPMAKGRRAAGERDDRVSPVDRSATNQRGRLRATSRDLYGSATGGQAVLTVKVADLSISLATLDAQNVAALTIGGVANQTYGIEIADGLGQTSGWIGLTNLILNAPTNVWYDPGPATLPQRYYRVVPGPMPLP